MDAFWKNWRWVSRNLRPHRPAAWFAIGLSLGLAVFGVHIYTTDSGPQWWYDLSYNPMSAVVLLLIHGTVMTLIDRRKN